MITPESFKSDSHAAGYVPALEPNPEAFTALLGILNDPANEPFLVAAAHFDHSALDAVVQEVEAVPAIVPLLSIDRFKQAVGVAVRLRMEELGWHTTGQKRPVKLGRYFKKAELYGH